MSEPARAAARLPVVLLWHMHQPHYRDALTDSYVLPWTYLHAIKDYADMAAHLEDNPKARAVVNFTPVLIDQLEELSRRVGAHLRDGREIPDPVLALLGETPLPTEPARRLELLRACLKAQRERMIERYPAYRDLARLAEAFGSAEHAAYISDELLRDLAVWYHLAWLGESVRRREARMRALIEHGCRYTSQHRRELLETIAGLIGSVIPRFRALAASGQCELSVTPYGHPILPLLLDFRAAREAAPASELPRHERYPGGADRAAWHMGEALRVFTQAFGIRPQGCWPSEGAVSEGTLELIERFEFRWAASSANVLRASLARCGALDRPASPAEHYDRPYRLRRGKLATFFRHDGLSDLIGFNYSKWHGDDAARNLAHELERLADRYAGERGRVVLIALDGENAWEHYPFNGHYFLSAMYAALADHPRLELTTLGAVLGRSEPAAELPCLVAGSWVHGTLDTWMGDAAKNAGWDLLCEAKKVFDRVATEGALSAERMAAAERQLALCESSDWFWWFGDYNPADAVSTFDRLYRRQLEVLYRMLEVEPPAALATPLSVGHGSPEHGGVMRRAHAG